MRTLLIIISALAIMEIICVAGLLREMNSAKRLNEFYSTMLTHYEEQNNYLKSEIDSCNGNYLRLCELYLDEANENIKYRSHENTNH